MQIDSRLGEPGTWDVLVVVGTRPEAIKLFPVIRALREHAVLRPVVVSTGQHAALVESILTTAGCRIDVDLEVGRPGLTLSELSAAVTDRLAMFVAARYGPAPARVGGAGGPYPVAALVHGDTSSAAAAALAAFHARIPVVHVEAGLRTHTTVEPFPEELNRQLIGRIAALHLAPTATNLQNLVRENVSATQVLVTGNTGIDALVWAAAQEVPYGRDELAWLETDADVPVVTVTAHRRENWGQGIENIAAAVRTLATQEPGTRFVVPLHPNPLVADTVRAVLDSRSNVTLTTPMDYLPFARLLGRSRLVITDSGGIQEEAPALDVPVLVCREATERGEGVAAGTLRMVGTRTETIVTAARELLHDDDAHAAMARRLNPYGDGRAAGRVVAALDHLFFDAPAPAHFGPGIARAAVWDWAGMDTSALPTIPLPADLTALPTEAVEADPTPRAADPTTAPEIAA